MREKDIPKDRIFVKYKSFLFRFMHQLDGSQSIFILSVCSLFPNGPSLRNIFDFTTADIKCNVAAVKCLPVLHHSVDCIFRPLETLIPFQLY